MPLLTPLITHTPNATPLFATSSSAGTVIETAGGFVATGDGAPANGLFVANVDAVPGGNDVFTIATSAGTTQWSMGVVDVQAPGNVGNDFSLFSYDNSGGFLGQPLTINRASGNVSMTGDLIVGNGTDASGGFIEVDGTLGVSRVFDGIYNPPVLGTDNLLYAMGSDGTVSTDVSFTPAVSGTYVVSATVNGVAAGAVGVAAWTWDTTLNSINFALVNGSSIVPGAQIYISGLVNPTGMAARGNLAADTFEYQIDILVSLTAGVAYDIERGSTGPAYSLGAGGAIGISIAKLND